MSPAEQASVHRSADAVRAWRGAALLSCGFRPFFLGAGVWALVGMALWPAVFSGAITIPTAFWAIDWHAHEMMFGYGGAVAAGFLLTSIPNWTGRLPVAGVSLAALVALWAAGRIAVFASASIGRTAAAAIDAVFLVVFAAVVAREVIAGKNWRNLKVAALVLALAVANVAFHVEDAREGLAEVSIRAALGPFVMLILLVGGRVTPSFTGNWIARMGAGARPVPFGRPDGVVLALSGFALLAWVAEPEGVVARVLALAAGAANLWRLSRWRGLAARSDALALVLHAGFLLAALGFVVAGTSALAPGRVPYAVGVHVWAIGAIGIMTLAMMTRATLGHTGHALVASKATIFAYLCVALALVGRLAMAFFPDQALPLMHLAACAWGIGFAAFLFAYGPMLTRRKRTRLTGSGRSYRTFTYGSIRQSRRAGRRSGRRRHHLRRSFGTHPSLESRHDGSVGFTAEEALEQVLDLIIPDHLRAPHWRGFEAAMSSGGLKLAGRPTLTRAVHQSGRKLYVEMTFALVVKDGAAEGSVAIARDVTERVARERAATGGATLPAS